MSLADFGLFFDPFGRPPFLPFSRTAAIFAALLDLPPFIPPSRPSAAAAELTSLLYFISLSLHILAVIIAFDDYDVVEFVSILIRLLAALNSIIIRVAVQCRALRRRWIAPPVAIPL